MPGCESRIPHRLSTIDANKLSIILNQLKIMQRIKRGALVDKTNKNAPIFSYNTTLFFCIRLTPTITLTRIGTWTSGCGWTTDAFGAFFLLFYYVCDCCTYNDQYNHYHNKICHTNPPSRIINFEINIIIA